MKLETGNKKAVRLNVFTPVILEIAWCGPRSSAYSGVRIYMPAKLRTDVFVNYVYMAAITALQ